MDLKNPEVDGCPFAFHQIPLNLTIGLTFMVGSLTFNLFGNMRVFALMHKRSFFVVPGKHQITKRMELPDLSSRSSLFLSSGFSVI